MINLTNITFASIFIVLLYFVFSSYNKRKYDKFLFFLLLAIIFLPMMQYVVFPDYKKYEALGIRYNGWDKVWLEYVLTLVLLMFNSIINLRNRNKNSRIFIFFIVAYALLSVPQFFTSINLERSFNGYIISVLNPILYASLFNKVVSSRREIRVSKLGKYMHDYFMIIIIFFFVISAYNVVRGVSTDIEDQSSIYIWGLGIGLGVFRARVILISFFLFLPALFVPHNNMLRKQFSHFFLLWLLFVVMLLLGNSRTMYIAFVGCCLMIFLWNPFKYNYRLVGIGLLIVLFLIMNQLEFVENIQNAIFERFHQKGSTILQSAENDERMAIWEQAVLAAQNSNYVGVGISNFTLLSSQHYSDAHSLYYTQFAERGFGGLVYVIAFLVTLLTKSLRAYRQSHIALFAVIAVGIISYSIVAYTANDWMMISQVSFSWVPYLLFIYLSLLSNSKRIVDE